MPCMAARRWEWRKSFLSATENVHKLAKLANYGVAMQVTIHTAKTNLSKLIEAALSGEEVVIARGKTPVARIVAIPQQRFKMGLLEGKGVGKGPDFFEPMAEEELALWEGGGVK
jgi:antitoxin (DNA-binding transcriptional repressor) of toxin-antitoxin stability system